MIRKALARSGFEPPTSWLETRRSATISVPVNCWTNEKWSGRKDLNLQPPGPEISVQNPYVVDSVSHRGHTTSSHSRSLHPLLHPIGDTPIFTFEWPVFTFGPHGLEQPYRVFARFLHCPDTIVTLRTDRAEEKASKQIGRTGGAAAAGSRKLRPYCRDCATHVSVHFKNAVRSIAQRLDRERALDVLGGAEHVGRSEGGCCATSKNQGDTK